MHSAVSGIGTAPPTRARHTTLVSRAYEYLLDNKMLAAFILLALVSRLAFWLYTGRTWEDALIPLTVARNAWEGFGLTHHASEPYVQSFTSPLGLLVPLIGEAVGQGLLAIKLASLIAAVPTVYYAYRIGEWLSFHWSAQILVLSYLATDQLQIFFGMAGMESQIATAVILANAYYYLTSQWWKLGVAVGLALLCRPEFIFWVPILGAALLLFDRKGLIPVVVAAASIALPWFIFTTFYYGSPVPHTIIAKSFSFRVGFLWGGGWSSFFAYFAKAWTSFVPFREFWFSNETPIPDVVLKGIAVVVIGLALIGVGRALFENWRLLPIIAFILAFIVYRAGYPLSFYFMWYLVPFLALLFVLAGYGLSLLAAYSRPAASAVGIGLAILYAMHIPFSFPLDRQMQREIDENVRYRTGEKLNELMGPDDTVVLEPLGYIGWAARNKTIYDWPGLASRVAVEALSKRPDWNLDGLVDSLKPNFVVMRPAEPMELRKKYPETGALYDVVARIEATPVPEFYNMGYRYFTPDPVFVILKRQ